MSQNGEMGKMDLPMLGNVKAIWRIVSKCGLQIPILEHNFFSLCIFT
jgi:hypothetical protein